MLNSKKNPIIYGTLILSFSGLFCRGIGFFYHLFISRTFGEEAMGIFQLTSPILMLAFSLTGAGMQTAISKYTASHVAKSKTETANYYLLYGCLISFVLSTLYSLLIFFNSETIAIHILGEKNVLFYFVFAPFLSHFLPYTAVLMVISMEEKTQSFHP